MLVQAHALHEARLERALVERALVGLLEREEAHDAEAHERFAALQVQEAHVLPRELQHALEMLRARALGTGRYHLAHLDHLCKEHTQRNGYLS